MTRDDFIAASAAQLAVTHPDIPSAAASALLGAAHDFLAAETRLDALDAGDADAACELTAWRYNRVGSEGLTAESYAGVTQSFAEGLPTCVLRAIRRRRRVVWQ